MFLKMHSYFQVFAELGCECLQLAKLHPCSLQNRAVPCESTSRFRWCISLPGLRFQRSCKAEQKQRSIWPLALKWWDNTASWGRGCLQEQNCSSRQPPWLAEQTLPLFHSIRAQHHYNFQDQPANCIICVVSIGWRVLEFSLKALWNEDLFKISLHIFGNRHNMSSCTACPVLIWNQGSQIWSWSQKAIKSQKHEEQSRPKIR